MSIQIINTGVLRHVASKMYLASCSKVVDENFYDCCSKLKEAAINDYMTRWEILNYKTYISYWTDPEIKALAEIPNCIFNCVEYATVKIPAVQFLKWLLFIRNNISLPCIVHAGNPVYKDDEQAVKFLQKLVEQVQLAIIQQIPEFQKAKANEVPPLESAI